MSKFITHQDYLTSLPIERQQRIKEKTESLKQAMQNNRLISMKPNIIYLNNADWDNVINLLNNPPSPNEKIKALFKRGYKNID